LNTDFGDDKRGYGAFARGETALQHPERVSPEFASSVCAGDLVRSRWMDFLPDPVIRVDV